MSNKKTAELQDKHWKALQLIEGCELTLKQIAKEVGISQDVMYDLNEGNSDKLGSIADLFHAEVQRINRKLVKKAQELTKSEILVHKKDLPELEENEYYYYELIGLEVYTEENDFVGLLDSILPTGGVDVYVIKKGEKEILIPAADEVIIRIDKVKGVIVIRDDFNKYS